MWEKKKNKKRSVAGDDDSCRGNGRRSSGNAPASLSTADRTTAPKKFKQLLAQDLDRFARALVEPIGAYSLSPRNDHDDRAQIKAIAAASKNMATTSRDDRATREV